MNGKLVTPRRIWTIQKRIEIPTADWLVASIFWPWWSNQWQQSSKRTTVLHRSTSGGNPPLQHQQVAPSPSAWGMLLPRRSPTESPGNQGRRKTPLASPPRRRHCTQKCRPCSPHTAGTTGRHHQWRRTPWRGRCCSKEMVDLFWQFFVWELVARSSMQDFNLLAMALFGEMNGVTTESTARRWEMVTLILYWPLHLSSLLPPFLSLYPGEEDGFWCLLEPLEPRRRCEDETGALGHFIGWWAFMIINVSGCKIFFLGNFLCTASPAW